MEQIQKQLRRQCRVRAEELPCISRTEGSVGKLFPSSRLVGSNRYGLVVPTLQTGGRLLLSLGDCQRGDRAVRILLASVLSLVFRPYRNQTRLIGGPCSAGSPLSPTGILDKRCLRGRSNGQLCFDPLSGVLKSVSRALLMAFLTGSIILHSCWTIISTFSIIHRVVKFPRTVGWTIPS
jgi:hypothetical protein